MSRKLFNVILAAGIISFSLIEKASACSKGLDMTITTPIINLDANPTPVLQVTVTKASGSNNSGCDFFLLIDNGTSGNHLNRTLAGQGGAYPYNVYKDAGHTQIIASNPATANANSAITGSLGNGSNASVIVTYYAKIDPNLNFPDANYNDNVSIRLYKGNFNNYSFEESNQLNFMYKKNKYVELSIVDSGMPFDRNDTTQNMNYGLIQSGAVQTCDIILQYNSGYRLSMSSANANRIKHATVNDYVPYTIRLDNQIINLTTGFTEVKNSGSAVASPSGGTRLPVSVTIGNTSGVQSGTYSDTVSVSVSAL